MESMGRLGLLPCSGGCLGGQARQMVHHKLVLLGEKMCVGMRAL